MNENRLNYIAVARLERLIKFTPDDVVPQPKSF